MRIIRVPLYCSPFFRRFFVHKADLQFFGHFETISIFSYFLFYFVDQKIDMKKRGLEGFSVCGYWGRAPPSHIRFSKVGPFLERIFQADFRSWLKIWNFQLLGCVNPEKLSYLESWFLCAVIEEAHPLPRSDFQK